MVRVSVLVLCAVFLTACTANKPGREATSSVSLEAGDDRAIVIVGVRGTREAQRSGFRNHHPRWTVNWLKFDPAGREASIPYRTLRAFRTDCSLGQLLPAGCNDDHLTTHYFVLNAVPGSYMLYNLGMEDRGAVSFTSEEGSLIFDNSIARNLETKRVPHFAVGAGEIVYAGDYVFDLAAWPVKLIDVERDDDGAKKALADHPNLQGPIEYRGPDQPLERGT